MDKGDNIYVLSPLSILYIYAYIYMHTHTYTHTHMHIHTVEYYAAIKRIEILPFAMTWMELEGIMLSKISQSEKDSYHMISLM